MYDRRGFGEALLETNIQYIATKYHQMSLTVSSSFNIRKYIVGVYIFYMTLYRNFVINIVDSVLFCCTNLTYCSYALKENFFLSKNERHYRRGEKILRWARRWRPRFSQIGEIIPVIFMIHFYRSVYNISFR